MLDIHGISNFAMNIKPLMKRLQEAHKPEKLTCSEMNTIVQYYLESLDLLMRIQTEHDIKECA